MILRGHVPSHLDLLFLGSSRYLSSSGSTFSVLSMTGNRVFYHYRLWQERWKVGFEKLKSKGKQLLGY